MIAGGANHIGDNPNGQRPTGYTRGELPRGRVIADRSKWVGNENHGWTGRIYLIECSDGLWLSYPQPTHQKDWASYLLDDSEPDWVKKQYQLLTS
jgi:hypothetical protein